MWNGINHSVIFFEEHFGTTHEFGELVGKSHTRTYNICSTFIIVYIENRGMLQFVSLHFPSAKYSAGVVPIKSRLLLVISNWMCVFTFITVLFPLHFLFDRTFVARDAECDDNKNNNNNSHNDAFVHVSGHQKSTLKKRI